MSVVTAKSPPGAKVLRDPIHDLIYFEPDERWMLDLIDTKEFQRLRRIRQLGLTHLVYPGAEHTRFAHSLGVFNFARRMIRKLRNKHAGNSRINKELKNNAQSIKIAALLHDIGHGPFSHVFERAFTNAKKHESWTCIILRDKTTEVGKILSKQPGIDVEKICGLISEKEGTPPRDPFLKHIVSSQLDADRMDYLLRDSLMTGSRYGQFDSEWVLNALTIAEYRNGKNAKKVLCLDASKGTGAIEGLLFARSLMFQYVYGHKTTRAYESELIRTLQLALTLAEYLPDETPEPVRRLLINKGKLTTKQYLLLDDGVIWWALRTWASWKGLPSGTNKAAAVSLRRHAMQLVRRRAPWRSMDIDPRTYEANVLSKHIESKEPILKHEFFLDELDHLPYTAYQNVRPGKEVDPEQIFFEDIFLLRDGKVGPVSVLSDSPMLKALSSHVRRCRFHFDRKYDKKFAGLFKKFGVCLVGKE